MFARFIRTKTMHFFVGALALSLSACSDGDSPTGPDGDTASSLVELGSLEDQGVRVVLSGPADIRSGYTPLEVKLIDAASGEELPAAALLVTPMMHMEDRSHSAPSESPAAVDDEAGVYSNPVVFVMPGTWEVNVNFSEGEGGREGSVAFAVEVGQGTNYAALTGSNGTPYFVSMVSPADPIVGKQSLELTVHTRETMMYFPPVVDLQIEMEPSMPSMGHGSPDNEQPVHVHNGHYMGKVNLIMTGDWRIAVRLKDGDVLVAETSFDITVQ